MNLISVLLLPAPPRQNVKDSYPMLAPSTDPSLPLHIAFCIGHMACTGHVGGLISYLPGLLAEQLLAALVRIAKPV